MKPLHPIYPHIGIYSAWLVLALALSTSVYLVITLVICRITHSL